MRQSLVMLATFVCAGLGACADAPPATAPSASIPELSLQQERGRSGTTGRVFTLSNQASGNAVLAYPRHADGSLGAPTSYPTGGRGTGGGLGNQGAVVLDERGRYLYAVNAGSNEISVFRVRAAGLTFLQTVPSGATEPISLTTHDDLLYVLHDGGNAQINGFRIDDGRLRAIAGSTRRLTSASGMVDPAQVGFTPDGDALIVTEKATNQIVSFRVRGDGRAGDARVTMSHGATPFGFAVTPNGTLLVSEAFGGVPDASALSSYGVGRRGMLQLVSGSVGTTETAACWVVTTHDGHFAYLTNTGSGTVSGFAVAADGSVALLTPGGITGDAGMGSGPIDAVVTRDDRFLYVLNGRTHAIATFRVRADGGLDALFTTPGLPIGANGLATE